MTDRTDPRRPNQLEPETPEDDPPGTLEEVAPTDPGEDQSSNDLPTNPYMDPDMPGGVPLTPGDPDKPVPPVTQDDLPREEPEKPITPI